MTRKALVASGSSGGATGDKQKPFTFSSCFELQKSNTRRVLYHTSTLSTHSHLQISYFRDNNKSPTIAFNSLLTIKRFVKDPRLNTFFHYYYFFIQRPDIIFSFSL